jgi:hypothetical protein
MYNEKKLIISNPKLFIGIPLSSALAPFLLALYLVKKTNIKYIMAFLNLIFIGLILIFFYLGHKK